MANVIIDIETLPKGPKILFLQVLFFIIKLSTIKRNRNTYRTILERRRLKNLKLRIIKLLDY